MHTLASNSCMHELRRMTSCTTTFKHGGWAYLAKGLSSQPHGPHEWMPVGIKKGCSFGGVEMRMADDWFADADDFIEGTRRHVKFEGRYWSDV